MIPRLHVVKDVITALAADQIIAAVGGSGLMAALDLTDQVHDWDLTTDAEPAAVQAALTSAHLAYSRADAGDGTFATRARFRIDGNDHDVDLIVGFAIHHDDGIVHLPTRITGYWHDLPLGDPAVWAQAYNYMNRHHQAKCLENWLSRARTH